jgi:hypothetical protein
MKNRKKWRRFKKISPNCTLLNNRKRVAEKSANPVINFFEGVRNANDRKNTKF